MMHGKSRLEKNDMNKRMIILAVLILASLIIVPLGLTYLEGYGRKVRQQAIHEGLQATNIQIPVYQESGELQFVINAEQLDFKIGEKAKLIKPTILCYEGEKVKTVIKGDFGEIDMEDMSSLKVWGGLSIKHYGE